MQLVEQMSRLGTETAFEVLAKARALEAEGKNVIHLEIGEPDFPTPAYIVEAGKRALDEGWTKYGPTPGFPELRETIATHISQTRNIEVSAENAKRDDESWWYAVGEFPSKLRHPGGLASHDHV